ncbi:MAG TPA: M48 family metalloprotease [Tepidisphaeraceae bacterium]|nr:M48 family metalloprotease [Tepidisphaeraceae bacterium]
MSNHRIHAALLLFLLVALGGCATDNSVINQAAAANQQLQPAIMNDAQLANYIQTLGDRIVAAGKRADQAGMGPSGHTKEDSAWMFSNKMQFHIVNSKTVNAFTTGGEHMYVYNALFQMCTSEDELAAVMSHEFAHVYCRHVQAGTNRQYAQLGAAGAAAVAGYAVGGKENGATYASTAGSGTLALAKYFGMGYTRHDEAQADEWGFIFYCVAGWDPDHFGDFFQAMIDAGYDKTPTEQSDHPMLKDRVAAAKQRAAEWKQKHDDQFHQPPIADQATFAQLKQRAAQIAASTPDDASLQKAQGLLASFSSCVSPADTQPEQVRVRQRAEEAMQKQQQQSQ